MTMTKREKFLLALIICGSLTTAGIARASDEYDITTYADKKDETITKQENLYVTTNSYEDCIFIVSDPSDDGGAINSQSSTITYITGVISVDTEGNVTSTSRFTDNTATSRGGAIYNAVGTIGEISGTLFEGNTAENGGAIFNYGATIGEISNSVFKDNTGYYDGGAIHNYASTIGEISGTLFDGNSANYGGAIYDGYGTITEISGSTFTNNKAAYSGGAIYNYGESSIVSIESTVFESNSAASSGGAIYNHYQSGIGTITDSYFTKNTALEGGAIYNAGTISKISGGAFTSNTASYSTYGGGAIYNSSMGKISEISDVTFTSNSASSTGGAIYNAGTISEISDVTFTSNSASSSGGAIYNTGTIEISSSAFTTNSATSGGGAIYNTGTIEISSGAFTSNKASNGNGGAIYNTGTIEISSSTFTSNSSASSSGGAIYNSGTIVIKGTTFESNTAGSTNNGGGAVYNSSNGTITEISGSTFKGNSALLGAAIFNDGGTISSIKDTTFESNTIDGAYGGAIYNKSSTIEEISGCSFTSNTAKSGGGAIYNRVGTISEFSGTSFTLNKAGSGSTGQGGAINNEYYSTIGTISGCTFTSNTAYGNDYGGGAIFNRMTINEITDSVFTENSAANGSGGAICNNSFYSGYTNISKISGSLFTENTAGTYGGAIYNEAGCTIDKISGSYFTDNSAMNGSGGAIYNTGTLNEISGSYFIGNSATGSGGAIYTTSDISSISESSFVNNSVVSESGDAMGGAIYNEGTISSIMETSFANNSAVSVSGEAKGGAFYSTTAPETFFWTGPLTGNYAEGATGAAGGAIYDEQSINVVINGDVSDNYVKVTGEGNVAGGVIYLQKAVDGETTGISVGGKVIGNHAETASGTASGGAFYNYENSTLILNGREISGNYVIATGEAKGGAIYNAGTLTMNSVDSLSGNYAISSESEAAGGAIYNTGKISNFETGALIGNYVEGATSAKGGAIYDTVNTKITINGDVSDNYVKVTGEGDVAGGVIYFEKAAEEATTITVTGEKISGNHAETANGTAMGGAFYNNENGTLTLNAGEISGNYVIATGDAKGGAIYNAGTLTLNGIESLVGNYAISSDGTARGGAIYNENADTTIVITGSIMDNYVEGDDAKGGAIYTTGDMEIVADGTSLSISGNSANDDDNVIYMAMNESGETGTVKFTLSDGGNIILSDNIHGEGEYDVVVEGNKSEGVNSGTFYLLNDLNAVESSGAISTLSAQNDTYNANFSAGNVTINTIDGAIYTYGVKSFTIIGDVNFEVDVDLQNETMDRFVTTNDGEAEHAGTLNISGVNLISDAKDDSVTIYFAEPGLKENVTASVKTAYTPIYKYNLSYEQDDGEIYGTDGGYFAFDKTGNNPAVLVSPAAQMGLFNAMSQVFGYTFEHSDYFMKLPSETRLAMSEEANEKKSKKEMKETDATKPAYYNQNELTKNSAWVKTYASNENVSYKNGIDSRDKYYGAIVGYDTNLRESRSGWASVFSGYIGAMEIRQEYDGGRIKQHGGVIGVTESLYKKNFYTAWTAAAGTAKAHAHTMYGDEANRNDTWGVAAKFGYNFELAGGKFAILPTFTASYTYVNPDYYTNAADVKIDGSGVRAVQLNPNVKFIMNMKNGLQPYLTVGEVWTVGQSSSMHANGEELEELELRPYTEYGIGVQKRWADHRDAYVQFLGHSHGRDGFLVNAGVRLCF